MEATERTHLMRELVGILYGSALTAIGLAWLIGATDPGVVRASWPTLLWLLLLAVLLNQLDFFWIVERHGGAAERWSAPLGGLVTIAPVFVFGPTALWLGIIAALVSSARAWQRASLAIQRWNVARTLVLSLACLSLGSLLGLALYERLGGTYPLPGFAAQPVLLAALAVATLLAIDWLIWSGYLLMAGWTLMSLAGIRELGLFALFEIIAYLPEFFAILAAAVYVQMGAGAFLTLIGGALLVSLLAQRLSTAVERSAQRSRELAQLEELGRALIAAPPKIDALTPVLAASVPPMFRADQIEIRLFSGQTLLHTPPQAPPLPDALWEWLRGAPQPYAVAAGAPTPWPGPAARQPLALAPVLAIDSGAVLGGICVRFSPAVADPAEALPALQSLAAQVASALFRAEEYDRALAHEKMVQELAMAAEIQASFLPETLPRLPGWQLAATLRPARQTSGDFYDVLELPGGRLGLVVADVTDKGTGAALYMALCRTLIRTFAFEYPEQPEQTLHAANKRLLRDSRSSMFVTVFYGVLDPACGKLTYCNAGHNPPYLLRGNAAPRALANTGIPLGIALETAWRTETVEVEPGDTLVMYTDGVTEAQNRDGEFFGEERLLAAVQASRERGAEAVQAALLAAVAEFVGEEPQGDDITILVAAREQGSS
ncbi:MAG: PP2C family protein-serine/threonine phosphatase [Chloroflexota bacterium]